MLIVMYNIIVYILHVFGYNNNLANIIIYYSHCGAYIKIKQ